MFTINKLKVVLSLFRLDTNTDIYLLDHSVLSLHNHYSLERARSTANMPTTIPYDPSLVLANIVSQDAINVVKAISALQAPVDAAQEELNSLLASRRSLDMTKTELLNLGIDTTEFQKSIDTLSASIGTSASAYATAKVTAENKIQPLRSQIQAVHSNVESPVDYVKTQIKTMPLASDSLSMDVQYFSSDTSGQNSSSLATRVSTFVAASTSWLGNTVSGQMTAAAQKQVSEQMSNHTIQGTLVLSVSCTHKNASVLAPFVINVDKGIKAWNSLFSNDQIKPTSTKAMMSLANSTDSGSAGSTENHFSIISGMTFGSSFVGMVHILNSTDTKVSEDLSSYAGSLQAQMNAGAWFESESGGFGVSTSIGNDVKNLLSTQNVTSHVTLISMGVIPSVVAGEVQLGVAQFTKFDPQSSMESIATIQNASKLPPYGPSLKHRWCMR